MCVCAPACVFSSGDGLHFVAHKDGGARQRVTGDVPLGACRVSWNHGRRLRLSLSLAGCKHADAYLCAGSIRQTENLGQPLPLVGPIRTF